MTNCPHTTGFLSPSPHHLNKGFEVQHESQGLPFLGVVGNCFGEVGITMCVQMLINAPVICQFRIYLHEP
jgi:hypothetical protein